jgi:hypothetical protein
MQSVGLGQDAETQSSKAFECTGLMRLGMNFPLLWRHALGMETGMHDAIVLTRLSPWAAAKELSPAAWSLVGNRFPVHCTWPLCFNSGRSPIERYGTLASQLISFSVNPRQSAMWRCFGISDLVPLQ